MTNFAGDWMAKDSRARADSTNVEGEKRAKRAWWISSDEFYRTSAAILRVVKFESAKDLRISWDVFLEKEISKYSSFLFNKNSINRLELFLFYILHHKITTIYIELLRRAIRRLIGDTTYLKREMTFVFSADSLVLRYLVRIKLTHTRSFWVNVRVTELHLSHNPIAEFSIDDDFSATTRSDCVNGIGQ